jgi:hypothetical protein
VVAVTPTDRWLLVPQVDLELLFLNILIPLPQHFQVASLKLPQHHQADLKFQQLQPQAYQTQ